MRACVLVLLFFLTVQGLLLTDSPQGSFGDERNFWLHWSLSHELFHLCEEKSKALFDNSFTRECVGSFSVG